MTNKEKQLKMLEALDLRVYDVVEIKMGDFIHTARIREEGRDIILKSYTTNKEFNINVLLEYDFEVVEYHQKTWGETKCGAINCSKCPLGFLVCAGTIEDTLSDKLDKMAHKFPKTEKGKKIYEICKEMLNEVRDE